MSASSGVGVLGSRAVAFVDLVLKLNEPLAGK